MPGETGAAPAAAEVWKARRAKWQRIGRRVGRLTLIATLVVALLAIVRYPLKVTERVQVHAAPRREVRAPVAGVITQVLRREGDAVRAGDLLMALDQREQRAQRADLVAERDEARADLVKLQRGSRPQEVAAATDVVARCRSELALAKAKLDRVGKLHAAQLVPTEELETARTDAEVKQQELARAQAELDLLRAGSRPEDRDAQRSVLVGLEAELRYVESELARGAVRSPIDGFVLTPRIHEKLGMAVERGATIAEVGDLRRMRVDVLVPEQEIAPVRVGQLVLVKISGFPDREFRGRVSLVPLQMTFDEAREGNFARVETYLDNPGHVLRDGMTGWAEIHCGSRSILYLVGRRLVRWFRVRFVV
jgi:multidrug resistance efflux pump